MANNIYHKSNWGSPEKDGWGDVYFNPSATNQLYTRSDNYENSEGTDKALASKPDTQSVLMTPTAYNVGSMNSILPPYEVLPTELVTNGDFDTDSGWTVQSGWAIANGVATCSSGNNYVYQTAGIPANTKVTVTLEITNYTSGSIRIGSTGYGGSEFVSGLGNYSVTYTTWYNTGGVEIKSSSFVGSIDNVSVKEVRNADFTFDRNSTATRVNKEGLIETVAIDTPRLDYPFIDGVVQSEPALLLEPSRTNLVVKSEDIQNWNKPSNATAEFGYQDPFKGNKAVKLSSSSTAQSYQVYQSTNALLTGNTYTFSMYAKKGTGYVFRVDFGIPDNGFVNIDLRDGSILQESGSTYYVGCKVESMSNDWYRISMISTFTSSAYYRAGLYQQQGDCYVAFAQIEQGSYPTSYIPTSGSFVTRAAETCNSAGTSDDFNDSEGVLYAELSLLDNSALYERISISDGGSNDRKIAIGSTQLTNQLQAFIKNSSVQVNFLTILNDIKSINKIAFKYKANDCALWINGIKIATDTNATIPTGLDTLNLDNSDGNHDFYGKTKELSVFKTALTDSELEALTSWDSFSDMATGQEYTIR